MILTAMAIITEPMNESERLADRLIRVLEGHAWHGPSLKVILKNVTPKEAATPPSNGRHGIWEILMHMHCWSRIVEQRLAGQEAEPTDEENWPALPTLSEEEWTASQKSFWQQTHSLAKTIRSLDPKVLDNMVVGQPYTIGLMLHGAVEHLVYHAGQIAILKDPG